MTEEKRAAVLSAVESAKKTFGMTAIKVELEAQLNREGAGYCEVCEGEGWTGDEDECTTCEGTGNAPLNGGEDFTVTQCQEFIETRLQQLHQITVGGNQMVYGRFYNDGSVDSEFTFTILLDNAENIFLLPKVIETFVALGERIGRGINTKGAGMHIAVLRHPRGEYGNDVYVELPGNCYGNFVSAMRPLLPALFFLAAASSETRQLGYRAPRISNDSKYSAIAIRNSALEYRVFDTCYDNPEKILDDFVVIANTLKFWSRSRKQSPADKHFSDRVSFGTQDGADRQLVRLYGTTKHLDLLSAGLNVLKPSYYSIRELKKQRGFKRTKATLKKIEEGIRHGAELAYGEYLDRFEWHKRAVTQRLLATQFDDIYRSRKMVSADDSTILGRAEALVAREVAAWESENKLSKESYIERAIRAEQEKLTGTCRL